MWRFFLDITRSRICSCRGFSENSCGIASLTPSDACIPTRVLTRPSLPYREAVKLAFVPASGRGFADAAVTPPLTPTWLQSPEYLRHPGDFRSYCHAPARLWPLEPSTVSLDLTLHWLTRGARLFQTGALPAHF